MVALLKMNLVELSINGFNLQRISVGELDTIGQWVCPTITLISAGLVVEIPDEFDGNPEPMIFKIAPP